MLELLERPRDRWSRTTHEVGQRGHLLAGIGCAGEIRRPFRCCGAGTSTVAPILTQVCDLGADGVNINTLGFGLDAADVVGAGTPNSNEWTG